MAWSSKVKIKHLFTSGYDLASVQASMTAIADVVADAPEFSAFPRNYIQRMRNIPAGDEIVGPLDYANRILDRIFDFADEHRIWID